MQLNHIEERRAKKMSKLEQADDDDDDEKGGAGEQDRVKTKKLKNLKKMMDYQSRKRREFRQREPIPLDQTQAYQPTKRKRSE